LRARGRSALTALAAPVLVLADEFDGKPLPRIAPEIAACFPDGRAAVVSGASHSPWFDNPAAFVRIVSEEQQR
jgi:proline iminopeptidase